MKKFFVLFFSLTLFLGFYGQALAQEVNSFELFWPMVAGKTIEDPLFFLKDLKENTRGFFVFSPVKKANYAVFLGVKRVLETEKLINDGKKDGAVKTLKLALAQLDKAEKNINKAKALGESFEGVRSEMGVRLNGLETLLKWLIEKDTLGLKSGLEDVILKVTQITSEF